MDRTLITTKKEDIPLDEEYLLPMTDCWGDSFQFTLSGEVVRGFFDNYNDAESFGQLKLEVEFREGFGWITEIEILREDESGEED